MFESRVINLKIIVMMMVPTKKLGHNKTKTAHLKFIFEQIIKLSCEIALWHNLQYKSKFIFPLV